MTKNIFFLGATGYIGGTILHDFYAKYPDFNYTAMVRTEAKGKKLTAQYPNLKIVIGDLDSSGVISKASEEADIVFSAADCDHQGHVKAIYEGMGMHDGTAYFIHTSGTGILLDPDLTNPGEAEQSVLSDKVYDDVENVKDITSLPDKNLHRLVDRIVLEQAPANVKACIVSPPLIYGQGNGPDNQNSIQVPLLVKAFIEQKTAFKINSGTNIWSNIHILDLSQLYVLIGSEALEPNGGKATWGAEGYYFAENGEHVWAELSEEIAKVAKEKGVLESDELKTYDLEQLKAASKSGVYLWGTNSKSKASRGRKLLGWKPVQPALNETIAETIDIAVAASKA